MTTSPAFHERLSDELATVGISGGLRDRILAEFDDHLACDPQADLGDPGRLARQFADELGTARARRAAVLSFGALALAGILFGILFATAPSVAFGRAPADGSWLASVGAVMAVLGTQVAFVAGMLAVLRAFQRRGATVVPAAEATVLLRRAAVGLAAGVASMVGIALVAIGYHSLVPGWWQTLTLVAAGVSVGALIAVSPTILAAVRLGPVAWGPAGDVFDDLGDWAPPALRGRPWLFAVLVAAVVGFIITAVGVAGSDPYDGALRGGLDALACLFGFATLGRYLGLWRPGQLTDQPGSQRA